MYLISLDKFVLPTRRAGWEKQLKAYFCNLFITMYQIIKFVSYFEDVSFNFTWPPVFNEIVVPSSDFLRHSRTMCSATSALVHISSSLLLCSSCCTVNYWNGVFGVGSGTRAGSGGTAGAGSGVNTGAGSGVNTGAGSGVTTEAGSGVTTAAGSGVTTGAGSADVGVGLVQVQVLKLALSKYWGRCKSWQHWITGWCKNWHKNCRQWVSGAAVILMARVLLQLHYLGACRTTKIKL